MLRPYLFLAETDDKGRAVFTNKNIPADTVIEISPVIVMTNEDRKLIDQTLLHDYIFEWGENHDQCCMGLGLLPMYNHSYTSNCEYFMDFEARMMFVKTIAKVKAGEELTINYNGDWNNPQKVWFDKKQE